MTQPPCRSVAPGLDGFRIGLILMRNPRPVFPTELDAHAQSLLKERFQLAAHPETKEMPVYPDLLEKVASRSRPLDPAHIRRHLHGTVQRP